MRLTNLQGERTCEIPLRPRRKKSLAEKIGRRKSVYGPGQPARRKTSRTRTKRQARNTSDVHRDLAQGYHTLAASRAGSVPIAYRLKAGKIRFERTCCILEKSASIFCSKGGNVE